MLVMFPTVRKETYSRRRANIQQSYLQANSCGNLGTLPCAQVVGLQKWQTWTWSRTPFPRCIYTAFYETKSILRDTNASVSHNQYILMLCLGSLHALQVAAAKFTNRELANWKSIPQNRAHHCRFSLRFRLLPPMARHPSWVERTHIGVKLLWSSRCLEQR